MARKKTSTEQTRTERPSARRKAVASIPVAKVKAAAKALSSSAPVSAPARQAASARTSKPRPATRRPRATPSSTTATTSQPPVRSPSQAPLPTPVAAQSVPPPSGPSVQEQLQDIERRLDALLDDVHEAGSDAQARKRAADAIGHIAARLDAEHMLEQFEGTTLLATAREMLSTDYYLRQWGRLGMRNRSEEVDDFGLDPTYEARVQPFFDALYRHYFRVQAEGLEHIAPSGRVLLIGNHSGTIPLDGVMLKTALRMHQASQRDLRWLAEDFVFHFPFLGAFMNRIGAVRACQENAQRLLAQDNVLAVFPEGIQGIGKLYGDRYRLQRFGRGGYIKLALRTGTPIVPVAIVGGEETYPLLMKLTKAAKPLQVPFLPVTPLFPWLGPLGLLPLPSRWFIRVGAPIVELSEYTAADAEDPIVVNRLNERVRSVIQEMLDDLLKVRGDSAFIRRSASH